MAHVLGSYILDNGLAYLDTAAVGIYICSQDPTTYTEATSTYKLGAKTGTAGSLFGAPADASPNGRMVTSVAISDGSITANGTAAAWAVVDATRLLANGGLASSQVVTSGNIFILPAFSIRIPNQ
jgi:hypothetical protein